MSRVADRLLTAERRLQTQAGVSVIYLRNESQSGETRLSLTAVPGREARPSEQPETRAGRVDRIDREYRIVAADLVMDGVTVEPQEGDRIRETINGRECVFELATVRGQNQAWRYTDQFRVAIRLFLRDVAE
jgi:hypothetical protein